MDLVQQFVGEVLEGKLLSVATAVLVVIIAWKFISSVLFPGKGKAPPVEHGLPLIGNAIQFGMDPVTMMKNGYKKHGSTYSLKMFGETVTLLSSAKGHELFFKAKEDEFSACQAYRFTVPIFGKDVVYDAPPEVLIEQRKMAASALSLRRFKIYVPMIEKECEEYFNEKWGKEGETCMMSAMNEITVLTSTRCLQGREIRETASKEFAELYWALDKALDGLGFFFPNLPLPAYIGRDRARKRIGEIFQEVINKRRNNPSDEEHHDFIQTLMEAKYKDGQPIPDEHIIGLMVGLLLAGQHTSNVTSAWTGVHLLTHPEVMKKIQAEQDKLDDEFKNLSFDEKKKLLESQQWIEGNSLTYEQIKNAEYMNAVVRETLRLRPPIIIMMRRVLQNIEHEGYTIRKGTLVAVSPSLAHRLESFWENPDNFEPERFTERKEDQKNPLAYIAFGGGAHACIGEAFAQLQVKVIWSWLLRHYNIELVTKKIEPNYKCLVVGPTPPVMIRYKRKN